jgi:PAS domain S-box-containing protein
MSPSEPAIEAALAAQREWCRVTLASIGDAVITTDRAGAVTFMNPIAERLTGWRFDEAEGGSSYESSRSCTSRPARAIESPWQTGDPHGRTSWRSRTTAR